MVCAGPATGEIFELQIVRFVVIAGPATDEIFELQIARLVVIAGPATDEIFELQIARLVVFAGPERDEIFQLQFVRFVLCAGSATGEIFNASLWGSWSLLGLPRFVVFADAVSARLSVPSTLPLLRCNGFAPEIPSLNSQPRFTRTSKPSTLL